MQRIQAAFDCSSRDEQFRATVYAMNTLLLGRGFYTPEQFETLFCEHIEKEQRRDSAYVYFGNVICSCGLLLENLVATGRDVLVKCSNLKCERYGILMRVARPKIMAVPAEQEK